MFNINEDYISPAYEDFRTSIKGGKSFAVTGLTSILRMFLAYKTKAYSGKKILFVTSTEQAALKYQSDMQTIFGVNAVVMPFQDISMYETVSPNLYDYSEQIKILKSKPDIVICPIKAILEKFPDENFFRKNNLKIRIGDSIDLKELAQKLVNLGYKKATMVNDIAEFSIRGDIADIYTLESNPVRIELWGDEVVDIRFFNNETQTIIVDNSCRRFVRLHPRVCKPTHFRPCLCAFQRWRVLDVRRIFEKPRVRPQATIVRCRQRLSDALKITLQRQIHVARLEKP